MFAGQTISGGWLSVTVTDCWQVAVLPLLSVAVQVTSVVPTGKLAGALLVTVTPQLSATTGAPRFTPEATHGPLLAFTVRLAGHGIVGGVASVTGKRAWHCVLLPAGAVAGNVIGCGRRPARVPARVGRPGQCRKSSR